MTDGSFGSLGYLEGMLRRQQGLLQAQGMLSRQQNMFYNSDLDLELKIERQRAEARAIVAEQLERNPRDNYPIHFYLKTFKDDLQAEIDEWLKGVLD